MGGWDDVKHWDGPAGTLAVQRYRSDFLIELPLQGRWWQVVRREHGDELVLHPPTRDREEAMAVYYRAVDRDRTSG